MVWGGMNCTLEVVAKFDKVINLTCHIFIVNYFK